MLNENSNIGIRCRQPFFANNPATTIHYFTKFISLKHLLYFLSNYNVNLLTVLSFILCLLIIHWLMFDCNNNNNNNNNKSMCCNNKSLLMDKLMLNKIRHKRNRTEVLVFVFFFLSLSIIVFSKMVDQHLLSQENKLPASYPSHQPSISVVPMKVYIWVLIPWVLCLVTDYIFSKHLFTFFTFSSVLSKLKIKKSNSGHRLV